MSIRGGSVKLNAALEALRCLIESDELPKVDHYELSVVMGDLVSMARETNDIHPDWLATTYAAVSNALEWLHEIYSNKFPNFNGTMAEHLPHMVLSEAWRDSAMHEALKSKLQPFGVGSAFLLLGVENCYWAAKAEAPLLNARTIKMRITAVQTQLSHWARANACLAGIWMVSPEEAEMLSKQVAKKANEASQAVYIWYEEMVTEKWKNGLVSGRWTSSKSAAANTIARELAPLAKSKLSGKRAMRGIAIGEPDSAYRIILKLEKTKS